MRSIGLQVPREYYGGGTRNCDQCGVRYYTQQLVEMDNGLLYCFGPGTIECATERTMSGKSADDARQIAEAMGSAGQVSRHIRGGAV